MFRRNFDSLLGTMLVASLVPVAILSELHRQMRISFRATSRRRGLVRANTPPAKPDAEEFRFDRAIEAYEALIDAVLAEHRA